MGVLALALVAGVVGVAVVLTRVLGGVDLPVAGGGDGSSAAPGDRSGPPPPGDVELLAEAWGDDDDTFTFELDGLAPFRGPGHWGCAQMQRSADSVRWACTDEGGTFPPEPRHDPPSVGRIETVACPAPCDVSDRQTLQEHAGSFADLVPQLRALDRRTWWLDGGPSPEGATPMLMARSYDADGDDAADHVLVAFFSAHPEDVEVAGRTMRDLYDTQG